MLLVTQIETRPLWYLQKTDKQQNKGEKTEQALQQHEAVTFIYIKIANMKLVKKHIDVTDDPKLLNSSAYHEFS